MLLLGFARPTGGKRLLPLCRAVALMLALCSAWPAAAGTRSKLPPRAVGILTLPGDHPWAVHFEPGFPWEWARSEGSRQYYFLFERDSYVPHFPTRSQDETQLAAARGYGVTRAVHLAEVEVDEASARGPHFSVTSLRVLDGTKEVPWVLTDLLLRLRKQFDTARNTHRAQLQIALAGAKDKLRADPRGTILRELDPFELVIYRPAWHAESRQLEVLFGYKQQAGFWIKSKPGPENPNVTYAPTPPERGISCAVTMGARYVVDARGAIIREEIFPPSSSFLPWEQPATAAQPAGEPGESNLRYHQTCGDPVCRKNGYRGPYPGVPACGTRREGAACSQRGEQCDLKNDCNMFLQCTDTKPDKCPR